MKFQMCFIGPKLILFKLFSYHTNVIDHATVYLKNKESILIEIVLIVQYSLHMQQTFFFINNNKIQIQIQIDIFIKLKYVSFFVITNFMNDCSGSVHDYLKTIISG